MYISINNKLSSHRLIIYSVAQKSVGGIIYVLVGLWKFDPCRFQSLILSSLREVVGKEREAKGREGEGGMTIIYIYYYDSRI